MVPRAASLIFSTTWFIKLIKAGQLPGIINSFLNSFFFSWLKINFASTIGLKVINEERIIIIISNNLFSFCTAFLEFFFFLLIIIGDFEKDYKLCMSQYSTIFGTTRIPNFGRDKLVTNYNSTHIAVVCRNHYFTFDVIDKENKQVYTQHSFFHSFLLLLSILLIIVLFSIY